LQQQVADLSKQVADLLAQVARLSKNSSNSSKPPSSDIVKEQARNNFPKPSGAQDMRRAIPHT
jgi:cell division protein FtsB